jgi:MFS family permease
MSLTATGLLLLAVLPDTMILVGLLGFVAGLGLGTVMPITMLTVQTVAGRTRLGAATAALSLARSTGGAAGAALFGAIVFAVIPEVDRHSILQEAGALGLERVLHAFHRGFICAAAVAALGVYVATRIPRNHSSGTARLTLFSVVGRDRDCARGRDERLMKAWLVPRGSRCPPAFSATSCVVEARE